MKTALVHDWLVSLAGSERVIIALHEAFPDAPLYTSVFERSQFPMLADAEIRTSFLQKVPLAKKKHQLFPMLRTIAFENFDMSGYDVVISSCHAESKAVLTQPETLHICYCYTPIRYWWGGYNEYLERPLFGPLNPLVKWIMPAMASYMRVWDRCASDRVDLYVATCNNVAERIRKYYRRKAKVIYPPVNTDGITPSEKIENYFLVAGRQIPYKRTDIAVRAFNRLGIPLKVVGTGPELEMLRSIAKPNVEFLGRVSDSELAKLYSHCTGFIFPPNEDFGITPLESMAAGRPVIAFRAGGALETIVEGVTGEFFDEQTPESLESAVLAFKPERYHSETLRERAKRFDVVNFKESFKKLALEEWEKYNDTAGRAEYPT